MVSEAILYSCSCYQHLLSWVYGSRQLTRKTEACMQPINHLETCQYSLRQKSFRWATDDSKKDGEVIQPQTLWLVVFPSQSYGNNNGCRHHHSNINGIQLRSSIRYSCWYTVKGGIWHPNGKRFRHLGECSLAKQCTSFLASLFSFGSYLLKLWYEMRIQP